MKTPVVAIIQARMGSERLPGKVLLDIEGQPMLERVVRRVKRARKIDKVVVATSTAAADDAVAALAETLSAGVTRGSEHDVLNRYRQAAVEHEAASIVRVSADSPFVDPDVIDATVNALIDFEADYAGNKINPSFPLGLDVEAFTREALEKTWLEAVEPYERAHVTLRMYSPESVMRMRAVTTEHDRHDWRWTVDTPEDLEFARQVFRRLGGSNDFSWIDVVKIIEAEPALAQINNHLKPKDIEAG